MFSICNLVRFKIDFENDHTICGMKGVLVRDCIYVEMTGLTIVSSLFSCNLIERSTFFFMWGPFMPAHQFIKLIHTNLQSIMQMAIISIGCRVENLVGQNRLTQSKSHDTKYFLHSKLRDILVFQICYFYYVSIYSVYLNV